MLGSEKYGKINNARQMHKRHLIKMSLCSFSMKYTAIHQKEWSLKHSVRHSNTVAFHVARFAAIQKCLQLSTQSSRGFSAGNRIDSIT